MVMTPQADPHPPFAELLSMRNITKRFPGVVANDQVNVRIGKGEVHALLGENGAGKTTLMNILYGLYQPDEGHIFLEGEAVQFKNPKHAMQHGIGLVAQHFMLARRHTVAENISLGLAQTPFMNPTHQVKQQIMALGERYGLPVDPNARIASLSPGEQQRVEILKALIRGANVLILDEPTSVLTPQEAEKLFAVMAQMKHEGKGVIFITHKLDEVMATADYITVLRKGKVVGTVAKVETDPSALAEMMVGRKVAPPKATHQVSYAEVMLDVADLRVKGHRGVEALKAVSFTLYAGEILGVAGVAGNGQAELIAALTGLEPPSHGQIQLAERTVTRLNARALFEAGIAHIPEDRNHMGVVPSMSVQENMILRHYRYAPFSSGFLLHPRAMRNAARQAITDYDISTPSLHTTTRLLSGGNVQKVILARELSGEPKLIVAAHPTYGLDVSATELTHGLLLEQAAKGAGVLLVSEDLEELMRLSQRIMVLFEGRVMGIVNTQEASYEQLGLMMAGVEA